MKPIQINDFCHFKFLANPTFSPDGKCACFTVSEADEKNNCYRSYIYLKKGNGLRKLTFFGKESGFQFLDGHTLLFAGNREEKPEETKGSIFYRLSLTGGEAEKAFEFPVNVSALYALKGGDFLAVAQTVPGFEELYTGDKKLLAAYEKAQKEGADYEEIEQFPFWWNGSTFTKGAYASLFYFDSRRKKLSRITPPGLAVNSVKLNPDKTEAWYFTSEVRPQLRLGGGDVVLWHWTGKGCEPEKIAADTEDLYLDAIEPGENFAVVIARDNRYGLNTDGDFYKLDYVTKKLSFYAKWGEAIGSSVGSDIRRGGGRSMKMAGDTLYFITTLFDGAFLYKLKDGIIMPVMADAGSVDSFDVTGDGRVLAVALYGMKGQELYDENAKQLSRFNEKVLKDKYVARPEALNYSRAGQEIHGFVLKPMDFDPEKKYPVIFDIHGGPKTVYGPVFYHEMQYWAGKGYFVIFCNPTGSDGRGAFMDIRGKYGSVDYEDLMGFCDAALAAWPQMDKENLFETGGSYGGFMTNWIIGHTDRFKACASQRSISNWFSFWGVSDIGIEFAEDQNASDPWGDPEKLWSHSPMKYADRVKTPTLFIHSFEDYRCPIDQGYQMFSSLVAHGVETRLVAFRGENHELSRGGKPKHRIKRLSEITAWFEKHKD